MIDKNLFLETLHEVAEIAATSSEKIKPEEVHRYFEGMELSEEQEKMVYEYLNLPPEAKAARQPECDKAAEEEEPEVETIEVYSDTDSASGIQIGADRGSKDTIEEEEEDAPQPKDVEQLSDSVYYKMYLNDVRERGEADEAKIHVEPTRTVMPTSVRERLALMHCTISCITRSLQMFRKFWKHHICRIRTIQRKPCHLIKKKLQCFAEEQYDHLSDSMFFKCS